jgi:hypothetical protein
VKKRTRRRKEATFDCREVHEEEMKDVVSMPVSSVTISMKETTGKMHA